MCASDPDRWREPERPVDEWVTAALEALARHDELTASLRARLLELLSEHRAVVTPAANGSDQLLSRADVAARVGLLLPSGRPANSLYNAIKRGDLVAYRISCRWRVRESDFEAWLLAQRHDRNGGGRRAA